MWSYCSTHNLPYGGVGRTSGSAEIKLIVTTAEATPGWGLAGVSALREASISSDDHFISTYSPAAKSKLKFQVASLTSLEPCKTTSLAV
jgi:hypothetical protein